MGNQSQEEKPNPSPKSSSFNKNNIDSLKRRKSEFEFCKACRLNHNQGQRHKYFPSHKKSTADFLARFRTKTEDIRFFLKNPSVLPSEYASRSRFWCIVCDEEIDELDSSFACCNAINHLASTDHLKNLKHFLWKYGVGMDRVDTFRILETDVSKWEKKCQLLKSEASLHGQGSHGFLHGPSNNIHNELELKNINNFENNDNQPLKSSSNSVMPLRYYTGEYQISHSGLPGATNSGSSLHGHTFCLSMDMHSGSSLWHSNDLTVNRSSQQPLPYSSRVLSGNCYRGTGEVHQDKKMVRVDTASLVAAGNVHSGAPPPWLDAADGNLFNDQMELARGNIDFPTKGSGKSRKLNPKRVGAAWAERRKMELEREKRGEVIEDDCDANWLPNFGRVWQSGSRKESRKEFENEKQKLLKHESSSEMPLEIQPYVSKRMQRDKGQC
ncbi:TITAN-like protein isoform X2 [Carica papaya]|uniref:TITAN-like protein isoform X2 n=1 Tax=Carica papaya TaxID=3649 RepID=UPI000B8C901A|nr:TITAN-like protein isoform X2 [Carica papaya]